MSVRALAMTTIGLAALALVALTPPTAPARRPASTATPRTVAAKAGSLTRSMPGWMTLSDTVRDAPTTAAAKSDQPLLRAATGFSCSSPKLGALAEDRGLLLVDGGVGVDPNPVYRPP